MTALPSSGQSGDAAELVVGVDGSNGAIAALRWALDAASLDGRDVQAVLVHDPSADAAPAARILHRAIGATPVPPLVRMTETVVAGRPGPALRAAAANAGMLVVGSRGHGPAGLRLPGSVSRACAQHGPVPTVVVRADTAPAGLPVAVGVDGSASSLTALHWAATQALLRRVPLLVVHASTVPKGETAACAGLDDAVAATRSRFDGLTVEPRLVEGLPLAGLLGVARGCQLLVVGSRGLGGFEGMLLGSVSRACVLSSPCTVAVVHEASSRPISRSPAVAAATRDLTPDKSQ